MNTMMHLPAVLASLWAAIFAYSTLDQSALGGAMLILFFAFIVLTVAAFDDDLYLISGRKMMGFRGNAREGISVSSKTALAVTVLLLLIATFHTLSTAVSASTASTKNVAILSPLASSGNVLIDLRDPNTAFGEVSVAELTPIIQLQFPYSINPRLVRSLNSGSGTTSVTGSMVTVSTGTTTDSHALLESIARAKYHPGQGSLARWTAVFDPAGTTGATAYAGVGSDGDGFYFGYEGEAFGVLHRSDGRLEYQTLTITNGATVAGGTITITLDGVAVDVEVVNGDSVQSVARAIQAATFANWTSEIIGADVVFKSHEATDKTGGFSLVDTDTTGVAGTFVESIQGLPPTDEFIAQTAWNTDNLDGDTDDANPSGLNLSPAKGNVYEVQFQWLGFGSIRYSVEDPATGRFVLVHEIKYANTNTIPSLQNPTLPLSIRVHNQTTTASITVLSSSMAMFTEGIVNITDGINASAIGTATGDLTTEKCVLAVKSKPIFQGVENRVNWQPLLLSYSATGAGAAKFTTLRTVINPILGGPAVFTDVNTATSTIAISTTGTTVSGGTTISAFEFGKSVSSFVLDLTTFAVEQYPGTLICFTTQIDGGTTDVDVGFVWRELF